MGEQLTHGRDGAGHEGSEPPPAHQKTKKRDMTQTKHELHCMAEYKHNRDVVWNFGGNARAFYDAQNETLKMHYPNGEVTVKEKKTFLWNIFRLLLLIMLELVIILQI